ncbi:hypothetical protein [Streptomyces sp. SPB162]|uniref:hypothetical protein n=1 Tax=Streptomyces sp. SPB162 TaxID=2940560 RepID=UPI0024069372|nr:hypothetical protein [Streptomyces sp. SPB162]
MRTKRTPIAIVVAALAAAAPGGLRSAGQAHLGRQADAGRVDDRESHRLREPE